MYHTKTYPVNSQVNSPQPNVIIVTKKTDVIFCGGWAPCITAGTIAITFLIGITYLGGSSVFPRTINLYANFVPIINKGYLQVFPFTIDLNHSIQDSFSIKLPLELKRESDYISALDKLLEGYPVTYEEPYSNCWLENPTRNHPCFYDRAWITQTCIRSDSYGYRAKSGVYNPCFILTFYNPEDWKPLPLSFSSVIESHHGHVPREFDPGFLPVTCFTEGEERSNASLEVEIYPMKGFSLLYFPVSRFNSSLYLPPLVAVRVKGIPENRTLTIECSILTRNAFVLWNNGKVTITFTTS